MSVLLAIKRSEHVADNSHSYLEHGLRMRGAKRPVPIYAFKACCRITVGFRIYKFFHDDELVQHKTYIKLRNSVSNKTHSTQKSSLLCVLKEEAYDVIMSHNGTPIYHLQLKSLNFNYDFLCEMTQDLPIPDNTLELN